MSEAALSVVNHIPAMVAYWDAQERCVFANDAYRDWFAKSPQEMAGMALKELLGPLYEMNLPHIQAALRGEKQVFERRIPIPGGGAKETIASYTPHIVDGAVHGFSVVVVDVTILKEREAELQRAIRERDDALAEVRSLRGLLPICSYCKSIRDSAGTWQPVEKYVTERSEAKFSHGICQGCMKKHYPWAASSESHQ
jgi:PAS domain S-box-containing protein